MALSKDWDLPQDVVAGIGDPESSNVPADAESIDPYFAARRLYNVLMVDEERMPGLLIESWPDPPTWSSLRVASPNVAAVPVVPFASASVGAIGGGHGLIGDHELMSSVGSMRPTTQHSTTLRVDLVERCLRNLDEDARDQEIEIASDVRGEVERILFALNPLPDDVSVVAEDGGCAEIEVFNAPHGGFVLRCEPGRTALCVVSVEQFSRRARYQDSTMLPDCFVEDGLKAVLQEE